MKNAHPEGNQGDAYLVGGELYIWDESTNDWESVGNLQGPAGPTGPVGTILGSYNTLEELKNAHPEGNQGDTYLVDGQLYIWDEDLNDWKSVGNLQGPTPPVEIQFSSASVPTPRILTGITGQRAYVNAIGLGFEDVASTFDPIELLHPAISIKTLAGGTITDIHVTLSIALGSGEATGGTVYAQLYTARPFNAKQFFPVDDTLMSFTVPQYAPIGSTFTAVITDVSIPIEPGTQLLIGFYSTSEAVSWGINAYLSGVVRMK